MRWTVVTTCPARSVAFVYVQAAPLVVQIEGLGKTTPDLNGQWLELGKTYSMTAVPAAGFVFKNWTDQGGGVLTNGRTLRFAMQPNLVVSANFTDTAKPTILVTWPKASQPATNATLTASGQAPDNAAVSQVWCQLNNSGWTQAAGTTNWSVSLPLQTGTNVLRAYAVDFSGNRSATNTVRMVYAPSAPLSVQVVGPGSVTPAANGKTYPIGKKVTLVAVPSPGCAFVGWTGSWATTNRSLSFAMVSNMTFTATFADTTRPVNIINYAVESNNSPLGLSDSTSQLGTNRLSP